MRDYFSWRPFPSFTEVYLIYYLQLFVWVPANVAFESLCNLFNLYGYVSLNAHCTLPVWPMLAGQFKEKSLLLWAV